MDDRHFYEPRLGHGLAHDPLAAIVAPRPIGWISTTDGAGRANLAPYSFFNLLSYRPPILGFSSSGVKDSLRNARATGEFVWNLATRALAEAMNVTSASVGHGVDEFALAGLEVRASRLVGAPGVAASPVQLECRVSQIIQLCGADGALADQWLVLGEVVGVSLARGLIVDGVYQTLRGEPVMRGGGAGDYYQPDAQGHFVMGRPKV